MVLVKLEGNKKRLIDFLMSGGEKPIYEITDYFKKLKKKEKGGISKQAVSTLIHSLNPMGLVSFRFNEHNEKIVILNRDKIVTKYDSDRFLPHIIITAISIPVVFLITLFTSWWYLYGSISIIVPIFLYISYLIFRTSSMKSYFYEREPKKVGKQDVDFQK